MFGLFLHAFGQSEIGYFYQTYEDVRTSPEMAKDNPHIASITPAQFARQAKKNTWQDAGYDSILFVAAVILFILSMYQLHLVRSIKALNNENHV